MCIRDSSKIPLSKWLLAIAPHNKEYQTPEFAKAVQWAQPAWSRMWFGGAEGGDSDFLVRRGYVHVCGNIRGTGKSDGGGSPAWDMYDPVSYTHLDVYKRQRLSSAHKSGVSRSCLTS